jgi:hypothetical protein
VLLTFCHFYLIYSDVRECKSEHLKYKGEVEMAKRKERQALALSARLAPQASIAEFRGNSMASLEAEMAMVMAADAERRANGGASFHLIMRNGKLSGFVKDETALVRFADGAASVTMHG